jgi:hypothetical protein
MVVSRSATTPGVAVSNGVTRTGKSGQSSKRGADHSIAMESAIATPDSDSHQVQNQCDNDNVESNYNIFSEPSWVSDSDGVQHSAGVYGGANNNVDSNIDNTANINTNSESEHTRATEYARDLLDKIEADLFAALTHAYPEVDYTRRVNYKESESPEQDQHLPELAVEVVDRIYMEMYHHKGAKSVSNSTDKPISHPVWRGGSQHAVLAPYKHSAGLLHFSGTNIAGDTITAELGVRLSDLLVDDLLDCMRYGPGLHLFDKFNLFRIGFLWGNLYQSVQCNVRMQCMFDHKSTVAEW